MELNTLDSGNVVHKRRNSNENGSGKDPNKEVELNVDLKINKGPDLDENENRSKHGINMWQTAFFILGEVAGSGLLALPNAVLGSGYIGIVLIVAFCIMAGYSGTKLGKCWTLCEERYKELRTEVKQPYQTMGFICYGNWMKWVVTVCMYLVLLGGSVVYVLLISGMLQQLLACTWNVSICYWAMIVACVMIPLSWLGTPKDFWPMAVGASLTVVVAGLLITIQALMDISEFPDPVYPPPTFNSFSLAFGTILFAYGGASTFPTIQNDMRDRTQFPKSAIIGFIGILLVYLPVSCSGFFVYGNYQDGQANIALMISDGPLRITAQVLLILHLLCAFLVIINPCFQDLESYLHIKTEFSIKRCAFRTIVVLIILFIGETVPEFSKIQSLVGGSGITVLTFICPSLFYMRLCGMKSDNWKIIKIPLAEVVFMWEIIIIGILGGIASTVSAVYDLTAPGALTAPCYVTLAEALNVKCSD